MGRIGGEILTVLDFEVDYHFGWAEMELVILFGGWRCGLFREGATGQ